jgi:hypothetical protein
MGTGCCRIGLECERELKTPDRFFGGTRCCFALSALAKLPLFIPALPFELAADIALLPLDTVLYANYKINPPLDVLIKNNNLEKLSKRLASGANPNDGHPLPILIAQHHHNLEAIKLLRQHGAHIPMGFFRSCKPEDIDSIRLVLQDGLPEDIFKEQQGKAIIHALLSKNRNLENGFEELTEIIRLLLDNGFSPNEVPNYNPDKQSALDLVENKAYFINFDKTRLVELLKAHGAKTYEQLTEINPEIPHLKTEGLDLYPRFNPVVRLLKKLDKQTSGVHYTLSTRYPGIEGPVLVVDYQYSPLPYSTRTTQMVHRRETPTAWKQEGEPFDLPTGWRLVLTPPGQKVPSRLLPDMPKDCILWEEWISLPNYEAYIEMPAQKRGDGTIPYDSSSLDVILQLDISREQWGKIMNDSVRHPKLVETSLLEYQELEPQNIPASSQDKKWLAKAQKLGNQYGVKGNWWTIPRNDIIFPHIVFSTHHKGQSDNPPQLNSFVPYPDEIMAVLYPNTQYKDFENRQEEHANGKDGSAYWNWKRFEFKGKGEFYLLYGDEVSDEALDKIQKFLTTLLEEQTAKP